MFMSSIQSIDLPLYSSLITILGQPSLSQEQHDFVLSVLKDNKKWIWRFDEEGFIESDSIGLMSFHHVDLARSLLKEGLIEKTHLDSRRSCGGTALMKEAIIARRSDQDLLTNEWKYSDVEPIRWLIDEGASMDAVDLEHWNALMYACYHGHKDVVKYLIEKKCHLDQQSFDDGLTALMIAIMEGYVDIAHVLIDAGARLDLQDVGGQNALLQAIGCESDGMKSVVLRLVEKDELLFGPDRSGVKALLSAAESGNEEIVRILLNKGIDVNGMDAAGMNALMCAAYEGHKEMLSFLVQEGALLEATSSSGRHVLIEACRGQQLDVVRWLIHAGVSLNEGDHDKMTALMHAASMGSAEIVKELLKAGADDSCVNQQGETVMDMAVQGECEETIAVLQAWKDQKLFNQMMKTTRGKVSEESLKPSSWSRL